GEPELEVPEDPPFHRFRRDIGPGDAERGVTGAEQEEHREVKALAIRPDREDAAVVGPPEPGGAEPPPGASEPAAVVVVPGESTPAAQGGHHPDDETPEGDEQKWSECRQPLRHRHTALSASEQLCPPNPKLLESTFRTRASRGLFGM